MKINGKSSRGFSLIELVIVVVILGMIAAIAIPRLSRASAGAADSALSNNLTVLRSAIDLYASDHGGTHPTVGTFDSQMMQYTDSIGRFSATKTSRAIYGPYLRKTPCLPIGSTGFKGTTTVLDATTATLGATPGAWFYNPTTGDIRANLDNSLLDSNGKAYNAY